MPKFFITEYELSAGNKAYILGDDARHLKKSRRVKQGDIVTVCDGNGTDFQAIVEKIESDAILIEIYEEIHGNSEPDLKVNLFMAMTKGEGFEYAIQKCVEAGVYSITPIVTERTIVNIQASKMDKKLERWNRISQSAAKQSGRSRIPAVSYPIEYREALTKPKGRELSVICYAKEDGLSIKQLFVNNPDTSVLNAFIGPEGGFDPVELEKGRLAGLLSISLGRRILRADTAGFFVTVAAMYEYGELDKKG